METVGKKFRVSVPRESLWGWLINTDQTNRAIGLPPMISTPVEGEHFSTGASSVLGLGVTWKENPFEWVEPEWLSVEREGFKPGFLSRVRVRFSLDSKGENETDVTLSVEIDGPAFLPFVAKKIIDKAAGRLGSLYNKFAAIWRSGTGSPFSLSPGAEVNGPRLEKALADLRRDLVDPDLIRLLGTHLKTAPDAECLGMRPFALADAWKKDRLQTLRLFLYATRCGLLNLEWQILCPNCRVAKISVSTLRDLKAEAHCDVCRIRFDAAFDQHVELRFSVNPAVRRAEERVYCIGNPSRQRHVLAQLRVPAGGERKELIDLRQGRFQLWSRACAEKISVLVDSDAGESEVTVSVGPGFRGSFMLLPGRRAFSIRNQSEKEALVLLEREVWEPPMVTAAFVTSLQEFRHLFSSEVLHPGLRLEIRSLTFLFSDLADSTALYDNIGDSRAFGIVRDHFSVLSAAIEAHQGGTVKTMGDGVMAVFTRSADAVAAALDILKKLSDPAWMERQLKIRIGLHTGPCIAINGNDAVDYFGTSVNVASRIEGICRGGELIFSQSVMEDPDVRALLFARGLPVTTIERELKGLPGKFTLYVIPARREAEELEKDKENTSV